MSNKKSSQNNQKGKGMVMDDQQHQIWEMTKLLQKFTGILEDYDQKEKQLRSSNLEQRISSALFASDSPTKNRIETSYKVDKQNIDNLYQLLKSAEQFIEVQQEVIQTFRQQLHNNQRNLAEINQKENPIFQEFENLQKDLASKEEEIESLEVRLLHYQNVYENHQKLLEDHDKLKKLYIFKDRKFKSSQEELTNVIISHKKQQELIDSMKVSQQVLQFENHSYKSTLDYYQIPKAIMIEADKSIVEMHQDVIEAQKIQGNVMGYHLQKIFQKRWSKSKEKHQFLNMFSIRKVRAKLIAYLLPTEIEQLSYTNTRVRCFIHNIPNLIQVIQNNINYDKKNIDLTRIKEHIYSVKAEITGQQDFLAKGMKRFLKYDYQILDLVEKNTSDSAKNIQALFNQHFNAFSSTNQQNDVIHDVSQKLINSLNVFKKERIEQKRSEIGPDLLKNKEIKYKGLKKIDPHIMQKTKEMIKGSPFEVLYLLQVNEEAKNLMPAQEFITKQDQMYQQKINIETEQLYVFFVNLLKLVSYDSPAPQQKNSKDSSQQPVQVSVKDQLDIQKERYNKLLNTTLFICKEYSKLFSEIKIVLGEIEVLSMLKDFLYAELVYYHVQYTLQQNHIERLKGQSYMIDPRELQEEMRKFQEKSNELEQKNKQLKLNTIDLNEYAIGLAKENNNIKESYSKMKVDNDKMAKVIEDLRIKLSMKPEDSELFSIRSRLAMVLNDIIV